METRNLHIPSINCGHCVMSIKRELSDIPGVIAVEGDAAAKTVTVSWEPPANWDAVKAMLDEIGFSPEQ